MKSSVQGGWWDEGGRGGWDTRNSHHPESWAPSRGTTTGMICPVFLQGPQGSSGIAPVLGPSLPPLLAALGALSRCSACPSQHRLALSLPPAATAASGFWSLSVCSHGEGQVLAEARQLIEKHTEFSQTAGFFSEAWTNIDWGSFQQPPFLIDALTLNTSGDKLEQLLTMLLITPFPSPRYWFWKHCLKREGKKKKPSLPVMPKWKFNPSSIYHPLSAFIFKTHFDCFVYCSLCLWLF